MSKFRVAFDIDLGRISPDDFAGAADELETARQVMTRLLFGSNRKASLRDLQKVRSATSLSSSEKAFGMAECLRRVKTSLQAEANLTVEALPADAVLREDTEEREALAA